jgi:hypothetical protein
MTEYKVKRKVVRDDDYIYYNLRLYNNDQKKNMSARFFETRSRPILDCASNYKLCVEKFIIPAGNIPITILKPNTYSVTLSYNGNDYQTYLQWVPNNTDPLQFGYIYSWSEIVTTVNNAFETAFTNLLAGEGPVALTAPFINYEQAVQLFSIYANTASYYPVNPLGVKVYMNTALFQWFSSWDSFADLDAVNGKNYLINIKNRNYVNQVTLNAINYSRMQQDFVTLQNFNIFSNILFKSSLLPINTESEASAVNGSIYGNGDPNFVSVVTDFSPTLSDSNISNRSYVQYIPQVRRWYNLTSNEILQKLDIVIYWQEIDGTEHQLFLTPNTFLSIKLLFQKLDH